MTSRIRLQEDAADMDIEILQDNKLGVDQGTGKGAVSKKEVATLETHLEVQIQKTKEKRNRNKS